MLNEDSLKYLYEDRQLMFDVLDNLHLGIIAFDVRPRPIFANQTMADFLKLPLESLLGGGISHAAFQFHSGVSRQSIFAKCLAGGTFVGRGEVQASDGELIPFRVRMFPLKNKQGQIAGVVGEFVDLRQHLALERFNQEYQHMLDAINTALVAIDANQIVTTCNTTAGNYFKLDPHALIGRQLTEIHTQLGIQRSYLLDAIQNGISTFLPEVLVELDGVNFVVAIDCKPFKDEDGNIDGAVLLCRDITVQRFFEQEAARADKLEAINELVAGTAHEIKNPLTSVRGFVQLLKHRFAIDAREQDYLDIMLDELDRSNDIINNFLLLARPQKATLELQDINTLLGDLLKLVEGQAVLSGVNLFAQLCSDAPLIVMETGAIKQVFLNLLQNAIQAMPYGGKLTVYTEFLPTDNKIVVQIKDTGIGIPQHQLRNLGKPFFTTRKGGTGLGLMVSYKIVNYHNGSIEVHSEENKGTTFTVKLPMLISR